MKQESTISSKEVAFMKRGSTLFLKMAIVLIGIPILAFGIFGLYWLPNHPADPNYAHLLYPIVIAMYLSTIPFFTALYQAFKLLGYIDRNEAFSQASVKALKNIKYCAITISTLYAVIMPFVFMLADKDDAPGAVVFGATPIFVSMIIATFAAVMQRLAQNAIDIKSENELTV